MTYMHASHVPVEFCMHWQLGYASLHRHVTIVAPGRFLLAAGYM